MGGTKYEGGTEGPTVASAGSGAPPLALDVRRVVGSGDCHHFHWRCGGCGVFVSVQQNNNNTLDTKPSCKIVQDSTKSTHDMIVLKNSTKIQTMKTYQEKTHRKLQMPKLKIPTPTERN